MILGRCNSSIARCFSELSKKQGSAGAQGCRTKVYLTERATTVACTKRLSTSLPILTPACTMDSVFIRNPLRQKSQKASEKATEQPEVKKNRLILEKSPYLLEHATNPVDWYPWGDKALKRAKEENKIIFVSIGYSTCHWCHVMEKESFKNEEIAKIMNENFVNIKVDREERPDIDAMCMMFVQRLRGHGGWPLSVFLTPDLMPITGGTYFSAAMFTLYLERIAKEWTEEKNKMVKSATTITERLKKLATSRHDVKDDGVPPIDCAFLCAHILFNIYDKEYGGFGSAFATNPNSPKFPEPCNLNFLLSIHALSTSAMLVEMSLDACLNTLRKMAYGGIHDHIGKGFHRYSVDTQWRVPHFEKMLYDQALIIQCYADTYIVTKDSFFSDIVDDIATYTLRALRHKEGGFFCAEDADSLPNPDASAKREGAFYVWTYDELKSLLKKKVPGKDNVRYFDLICRQFSVRKEGNVESSQDPHGELTGKNVLWMQSGIEDTANHFKLSVEDTQKYIQEACDKLFLTRSERPLPGLDDKIITAWNGLIISGLARAGIAVKNQRYVEAATEAAKFIEQYLFDKEKRILLRSCYRRGTDDAIVQTKVPISGFHEDYAFLVKGLLDLYEATFDPHWLEFAEELQNIQDRLFWDSKDGGYFSMAEKSPILTIRTKDSDDGAQPSSNSLACSNMLRLATYLDRDDLRNNAAKLVCAFGNKLVNCPAACPQMMLSLIEYHQPTQIYVTGKMDAKETVEMLNIIRERLMPGRVLIFADSERSDNILFRRNEIVKRVKPQENRTTVLICRDRSCSLPISDTSLLIAELDKKVFTDL
ncbi:PREDICTED: spermatogenesis-associated protein 20 isoform X2 [Vollenhovia emeryi]|nr:PREDICTED: spermatogenesis-associated protein 20 isoform X2 [Vollenhovia emeryi]XP_011875180.1 PREDICTED: spermatogenesis-associated protein 20 isoform X2 [Vollenhovia emeryi]